MVVRRIYECKLCEIRTYLKTDFKRHELTRKHQIRVKMTEETRATEKNLKNVNIVNLNVNPM